MEGPSAPGRPKVRVRRVTISPVGKSTPGVTQPNNGADHGPDDPGTSTNGIQEFLNHHVAEDAVGEWWPGIYPVPAPVVVPFNPDGFHWIGPGRDAMRVVAGPGCAGKDMISVAGDRVMIGTRVEGMCFGAKGVPVRHLVNFANPTGPDGETSTRWKLRDCRFGGQGPTGFLLVFDWQEDAAIDDSVFFDCPTPTPGPTNGQLSWRIPKGMGVLRNTHFKRDKNPSYAYVQTLSLSFRDCVLPNQLEVGSGPGNPRQLAIDHCWQQLSIPGRPNFLNNSGFRIHAHVLSTWIYAFGGQPVFGGNSPWDLILDQTNVVGDDSAIPLVAPGVPSTVRGRNPVLAKGVTSPPIPP